MTDSTCRGWVKGTTWTKATVGASSKGADSSNHAEQVAYAKQKTICSLYRFTQTTFPCVERGVGSCDAFFRRESASGKVSFHFQIEENIGGFAVPAKHYEPLAEPTKPADDDFSVDAWKTYNARHSQWKANPFVLVEAEVKAASGDLYYHNGKAYFGARPHGFPGPV